MTLPPHRQLSSDPRLSMWAFGLVTYLWYLDDKDIPSHPNWSLRIWTL